MPVQISTNGASGPVSSMIILRPSSDCNAASRKTEPPPFRLGGALPVRHEGARELEGRGAALAVTQ